MNKRILTLFISIFLCISLLLFGILIYNLSLNLDTVLNIILTFLNIITLLLLGIELRNNKNVNISTHLLTVENFFAENNDIQSVYNLLLSVSLPNQPTENDFKKANINAGQLSTYLTFFESFIGLLNKKILGIDEIHRLFGHRFFSIVHNLYVQETEIYLCRFYYENLFLLYEKWFIHCIKNKKEILYIKNYKNFLKMGRECFVESNKTYRLEKNIKKYQKLIDEAIKKQKGKKYDNKKTFK